MNDNKITVTTTVHAHIEKVWDYYNNPEHVKQWAFASDDWEAPHAENDLRVGGRFVTRMSAKDKSAGFDFGGTYTQVKEHELLSYVMDDERTVSVQFTPADDGVKVSVTFDMEKENSRELQQDGWQAILDNFKKHVEAE